MLKEIVILSTLFITSMSYATPKAVPVLLVRGIDSTDNILRPLEKALLESGVNHVKSASYTPRFGQVGIDEIAVQIAEAALKLKQDTKSDQVDVVGFSMGALASRYFIQRLAGKKYVRKFISISGPQNGTYAGYVRAFQKGVRDMLPGSELIEDLNRDIDPWGDVEVYSFYTPYDLIVFPAKSAVLKKSAEVKQFEVTLHHQMVKDPAVLSEVVRVLKQHRKLERPTAIAEHEVLKGVNPS